MLRRALAMLAALSAVLPLVLGTAVDTAAASGTTPSTLKLAISRASVESGSTVTLYASLTDAERALPNQRVALDVRHGDTWRYLVTLTTNERGQASYVRRPPAAETFRVRWFGTDTHAAATSNYVTVQVVQNSAAQKLIAEAARHRGKPYRYGATGPNSFDCSGFTGYVFRVALGKVLPRSSRDQYAGAPVKLTRGQERPGDLIFTYDSSGRIYHVGLYAGNGYMWHSPQSGDVVKYSSIFARSYKVGRYI
ncbi:MAG TPA: NlpC/P60 family protein [Mycobacteriales bacterium]|nr:NlpC/P60 family protein [Mycobacteriales bacterium]